MKLTAVHACDLCTKPGDEIPEIIDGRVRIAGTKEHPTWTTWAWVCPNCWKYFSATEGKLGTGLGQRWENKIGGNKLEG